MLKSTTSKVLMVILTLLVCVLGFSEGKALYEKITKESKSKPKIKKIGIYKVNAIQTDYQKEVEKSLETVLQSQDGKAIVSEISKYFISDLFTLRDKKSYTSVGGTGFVFPGSTKEQFKTNAIDSYYRDISQYIDSYGQKNLPLVTGVEVGKPKKIKKKITVRKKDTLKVIVAFDVGTTWTYEDNDKINTKKLVNEASIRFVKASDENWYVYQLNPQNKSEQSETGY